MRHIPLLASIFVGAVSLGPAASAGEAATHSGQSVRHSAAAVGKLAEAGFELVSVAVAVPFRVIGAAADDSAQSVQGAALLQYPAKRSALPVTDAVLTAVPPGERLAKHREH